MPVSIVYSLPFSLVAVVQRCIYKKKTTRCRCRIRMEATRSYTTSGPSWASRTRSIWYWQVAGHILIPHAFFPCCEFFSNIVVSSDSYSIQEPSVRIWATYRITWALIWKLFLSDDERTGCAGIFTEVCKCCGIDTLRTKNCF